jgi:hypothetical protein
MEGRPIHPDEFPVGAELVRPSSAPRGVLPNGSTELNEGGRSTHSSAPGTGASRAVPPSPFAIAISQLEAERLQPVSYYRPVEQLDHDLRLLVRVLDDMLNEIPEDAA